MALKVLNLGLLSSLSKASRWDGNGNCFWRLVQSNLSRSMKPQVQRKFHPLCWSSGFLFRFLQNLYYEHHFFASSNSIWLYVEWEHGLGEDRLLLLERLVGGKNSNLFWVLIVLEWRLERHWASKPCSSRTFPSKETTHWVDWTETLTLWRHSII